LKSPRNHRQASSRQALKLAPPSSLVLSLCLFAPPKWSPDNHWLAFVGSSGDPTAGFAGRPAFEAGDSAVDKSHNPQSWQLWVVNQATGSGVLVDESPLAISAPAWSPDGQSIAYVKFEQNTDRVDETSGRLVLVRADRRGSYERIHEQTATPSRAELARLVNAELAWSPNGLELAVPWLGPERLLIISPGRATVTAELSAAGLPAWSNEGKFLCYFQRTQPEGYHLVRSDHWDDRRLLIDASLPTQPATWERGGDALFVGRHRQTTRPGPIVETEFEVLRVAVPQGGTRLLARYRSMSQPGRPARGGYFVLDQQRDALLTIRPFQGEPCLCEWRAAESQRRRWHPLDYAVSDRPISLWHPQLSSDGRYLALRFGGLEPANPVGVFDMERQTLVTLAPTDSMRARALAVVVAAIRRLVVAPSDNAKAPTTQKSAGKDWISGSLELFAWPVDERGSSDKSRQRDQNREDPQLTDALERLTRHGVEILAAFESAGASTRLRSRLAESALLCHYLRGQFRDALRDLDDLAADPETSSDAATSVLVNVIRAQCLLTVGEAKRAYRILEHAKSERTRQLRTPENVGELLELRLLGIDVPSHLFRRWPVNTDPILARIDALVSECQARLLSPNDDK
jgi:hypothetical protein